MKRFLLLSLLCLSLAMIALPALCEEEGGFVYEPYEDGVQIVACNNETSGELTIPVLLGGLPVRCIGDYALAYQGMERVVLPEGLYKIGACAFNACYHLKDIRFPKSLRTIGADAFLCCQSLTELTLPRDLELVEDEAFYNCLNLQKVSLCADTVLGSRVFESCFSLTHIDRYLNTNDEWRQPMNITTRQFGTLHNGQAVTEYICKDPDGCGFSVIDYGGALKNLWVKDKDGNIRDVVLGFDTVDRYEDGPNGCAGALIGRVGNRIGGAAFDLDGVHYTLMKSEGENNLHSAPGGFHKALWQVEVQEPDTLILRHTAPDGEAGFPGKLDVEVSYTFRDSKLSIHYKAVTDKPTLCNLTNHAYFNLKGSGCGDIKDHVLQINATDVTEVGYDLIPTGKLLPIASVPYDFSKPTLIAKQIARLNEDAVYAHVGGVDFNYCAGEDGVRKEIASVYCEESGIEMKVMTDQPGVQCFMAMGFDFGGKDGAHYGPFAGIALETQHYPDAPHHPNFPQITLRPGEVYDTTTEYCFDVK